MWKQDTLILNLSIANHTRDLGFHQQPLQRPYKLSNRFTLWEGWSRKGFSKGIETTFGGEGPNDIEAQLRAISGHGSAPCEFLDHKWQSICTLLVTGLLGLNPFIERSGGTLVPFGELLFL
jgi:hypothetical protein